MKSWVSRFIRWALSDTNGRPILSEATARSDSIPTCRIGVIKAMNGRILEVSTYKHNPHGPDWTTEMFIVPEDQTLTQALTTLLTLKGLNS